MDKECDFCKENGREIIASKDFNACSIEIYIEDDGSLAFNTFDHSTGYTEDLFGSFEIVFCPMCGSKLINNA